MEKMIFRFDDVCINADMNHIERMTDFLFSKFPDCEVIWAISPLVHDMTLESNLVSQQRIFPKILNAHSDFRVYYMVDKLGIPNINPKVTVAAHALIHVDHRLLDKSAQEMSILISCSLCKSKVFVPPFNKWNKDTESICIENGIKLVKFEEGWKSIEYNKYNPNHRLWYLHAREIKFENFTEWFSV